MIFLRIIHIYLLMGAATGIFFSLAKLETTLLPFVIYVALTGYLVYLFFKKSRTLLFNSLVLLFVLQLISIKTIALGYVFTIGLCFFFGFGIDPVSARESIVAFSTSDFTAVKEGQNQIISINLFAVVLLLLLVLTKEK